ncbi:MAG: hypothetical protein K6L73_07335 [Cellvibrionaceae bacterium]
MPVVYMFFSLLFLSADSLAQGDVGFAKGGEDAVAIMESGYYKFDHQDKLGCSYISSDIADSGSAYVVLKNTTNRALDISVCFHVNRQSVVGEMEKSGDCFYEYDVQPGEVVGKDEDGFYLKKCEFLKSRSISISSRDAFDISKPFRDAYYYSSRDGEENPHVYVLKRLD